MRAVYDFLRNTGGGGTEANGKPPNHLDEAGLRHRHRGSDSTAEITTVTRTDTADWPIIGRTLTLPFTIRFSVRVSTTNRQREKTAARGVPVRGAAY